MTADIGRDRDAWLARAVAAEARAAAEARRAQRAEHLAEHGHERLRELNRSLAEVHRLSEERHRITAALHRSLVRQRSSRLGEVGIGRLMATAISDVFGCPSTAVLLIAADGSTAECVGTDSLATESQDLELVHGEGPLHAAWVSGEQVEASSSGIVERWPHYGSGIDDVGLRTVLAVPLNRGAAVLGAVGVFNPHQVAGSPPLARLAGRAADVILDQVRDGDDFERLLVLDGMQDIHQAAGAVAAETACDVRSAMALIRARAFASGESAATVARRVLDGELHLSL